MLIRQDLIDLTDDGWVCLLSNAGGGPFDREMIRRTDALLEGNEKEKEKCHGDTIRFLFSLLAFFEKFVFTGLFIA